MDEYINLHFTHASFVVDVVAKSLPVEPRGISMARIGTAGEDELIDLCLDRAACNKRFRLNHRASFLCGELSLVIIHYLFIKVKLSNDTM